MASSAILKRPEPAHTLQVMTQPPYAGGPVLASRYRPQSGFVAHLVAQHEDIDLFRLKRRGSLADANRAYAANAARLQRRMPPGLGRSFNA